METLSPKAKYKQVLGLKWWSTCLASPEFHPQHHKTSKQTETLSWDPLTPFLGTYTQTKGKGQAEETPTLIAVLLTIAELWSQPMCPSVGERI
jgi:hypothetical protein